MDPQDHSSEPREARTFEQRTFAFALMIIAGWCDAAGFLLFAGLYVSFMSGDGTQLGVKAASEDWGAAAKFLGAQALFVLGAGLGRFYRTGHPRHGRRNVLVVNAVLLAATALLATRFGVPAFILAVLAMGLQNATMTREAGVPIGTMITGTLARLGENLADMVRGKAAPAFDNFSQWAFFIIGALGGAVAYHLLHAASFWLPAIASAALIPLAMRLPAMKQNPTGRLA